MVRTIPTLKGGERTTFIVYRVYFVAIINVAQNRIRYLHDLTYFSRAPKTILNQEQYQLILIIPLCHLKKINKDDVNVAAIRG